MLWDPPTPPSLICTRSQCLQYNYHLHHCCLSAFTACLWHICPIPSPNPLPFPSGISASDRARTIRRLADPTADASHFRRPGHIFPLRYRPGGVLVRPGHTEVRPGALFWG